jgi:hypothetical protein
MQKKLLLGVTGLALLFVFVLAACDTNLTGGFSTKEDLNSVPGPALNDPLVEDGLIVLSWNSVTNASGYRIVRKDLTTNETKVLTDKMVSSGGTSLSYADIVSWTNQLVDGQEYEYTVISLNESGINRAAGDTVILSGESKKRVTAKVPASITVEAPVFEVRPYKGADGADKLLVIIDSKPNLAYRVAYAYSVNPVSNEQLVQDLSILNPAATGGGFFGEKVTAEFPLIGGKNTVTVQVGFASGASYYPATNKTAKLEENEFTSLPAVSGFNATRTGEAVKFTWDDILGADPASWKIYKVKTSGPSSNFSEPNIKVLSEWSLVAFTSQPEKSANSAGTGYEWTAYESAPPLEGCYTYALIATIGTQKSRPATDALGGLGPIQPSSATLTATVAPDGKIQLTWEAALQGEKYELSYAPVISATPGIAPSPTNYVPQAAFAPVLDSGIEVPEASYPQGRAVVFHEPAKGKSYAYKLVVTKGGAKSQESVKVVAEAPYTASVSFSLSVSAPNNPASTQHLLNADEIRLRVVNEWGAGAANTGQDLNAYTFQVYYRLFNAPQSTYQAFGSPVSYAATDEEKYVTVTGLEIGRQYQFKVVVTDRENSSYQREITDYAAGYSTSLNQYGSVSYYTTAQTGANFPFPERSLVVPASGAGNGLKGLRVKVEYPSTAAGGTSTADLEIQVLNYNVNTGITGVTPSWQHRFYIQLPNNVSWTAGNYQSVEMKEYLYPIQYSNTPITYSNVYGN